MEKPDPKVFAQNVLWYLCGLQAHLREVEGLLVAHIAKGNPDLMSKMLTDSKARREKLRQELFEDAAKMTGLDGEAKQNPSPDQTDPPSNPRA